MGTLTRRSFLVGALGAAAATPAAVWYARVYGPRDLEVVRHSVAIPNLAPRLEGLRAVQISDLHLLSLREVHVRAIRLVQELAPDVVFVTGDLVDQATAIPQLVELLQGLSPPLGIWAIPGNWDNSAGAVPDLQKALPSVHGSLLVNESHQLESGLWVAGVDDPASWRDDLYAAARDVPTKAARILLAHSPDIVHSQDFWAHPELRFGLILAGHTHGGQVNLPLLNGAWLHRGLAGDYTEGFFDVYGSRMYVNRGIGTTTLNIRIAARPEITLFTFHPA
jgi:predicted MPP superfamily phosphohydrolase